MVNKEKLIQEKEALIEKANFLLSDSPSNMQEMMRLMRFMMRLNYIKGIMVGLTTVSEPNTSKGGKDAKIKKEF